MLTAFSSRGKIHQRQSLDVPSQMVNGVGGGKDDGAARGKGQTHQRSAGDLQRRLAIRTDLDDATFAGERSCDIEIAFGVECHALRSSQATVEG